MNKKLIGFGIGALLIAAPLITSADTGGDLQSIINNLLSQIKSLQAQILHLGGSVDPQVSCGSTGGMCPSGTKTNFGPNCEVTCSPDISSDYQKMCPLIARTLMRGSEGEDVKNMQQFLRDEGVFSASVTGYFGSLTEAALKNWQSSQGIVSSGDAYTTGWGRVGPATRDFIGRRCGQSNNFTADPSTGQAPLTVIFTTSAFINDNSTYSVDFGDGQNGAMAKGSCVGITAIVGGQGGIKCSYTLSHTYTSNGTYSAKLLQTIDLCGGNPMCMAPIQQKTVGWTTVTVGTTNTGGSLRASPQSGQPPLNVSFYYDGSNLPANYVIDYGDGQNSGGGAVGCGGAPCRNLIGMHTYTSNGTYTATVSPYIACLYTNPRCMMAQPAPIGTVTITVGSTNTQSTLQANPQSGSAPLAVNFTFLPKFDMGLGATVTINYGDGTSGTMQMQTIYCFAAPCLSPWNASHTYSSAGTYSVKVYANSLSSLHCNPSCGPDAQTTVYAGTTATGAPTISGLDAPTTLNAGQSGTWTVHASVPNQPGAQIRYSVVWGDEGQTLSGGQASAPAVINTSSTFTHTYSRAGTYTPVFTVANDAGSAQTSSNVTVSGTSASIQQVNLPATFTLQLSGIAEVHSENFYMTFNSIAIPVDATYPVSNAANVSIYKISCARGWPSNPPQVICDIAPFPPQTLFVQQGYASNFSIGPSQYVLTLQSTSNNAATFGLYKLSGGGI